MQLCMYTYVLIHDALTYRHVEMSAAYDFSPNVKDTGDDISMVWCSVSRVVSTYAMHCWKNVLCVRWVAVFDEPSASVSVTMRRRVERSPAMARIFRRSSDM